MKLVPVRSAHPTAVAAVEAATAEVVVAVIAAGGVIIGATSVAK